MDEATPLLSEPIQPPDELRHGKRPILKANNLEHILEKMFFFLVICFQLFHALECY